MGVEDQQRTFNLRVGAIVSSDVECLAGQVEVSDHNVAAICCQVTRDEDVGFAIGCSTRIDIRKGHRIVVGNRGIAPRITIGVVLPRWKADCHPVIGYILNHVADDLVLEAVACIRA